MRGIVRYPDLRMMLFFIFLLSPIFILAYRIEPSAFEFSLSPLVFFAISLLFLLLSIIEVPILKKKTKKPRYSENEIKTLERLHSVQREEIEGGDGRLYDSMITLNLGGFILPLLFALVIGIISPITLEEFVIIAIIMFAVTNLLSFIEPGIGIVAPPHIGLLSLPLAILVTPVDIISGMLVSGIIGIELGLVTKIFSIDIEVGSPVFSLGGKGNFEAIYLVILVGLLVAIL